MKNTISSDYKSLKLAYIEVKAFIEKEVGTEVPTLQTKIENDLGCAGDDNYDLLVKFIERYNLDHTEFDYSKHFLSEGELTNPLLILISLPLIPFAIIFLIIKIMSIGKMPPKMSLFPNWQRKTLDLSFGDMLTWYLMGKYCLREDIEIRLYNR